MPLLYLRLGLKGAEGVAVCCRGGNKNVDGAWTCPRECIQSPLRYRITPGLRREVKLVQEPGSLHPTVSQNGTLRNSGTLYLNLAFHIVMKFISQYGGMEHILCNLLV